MNDSLYAMTQTAYTEDQIERRAYSVAMNAVREMRVAYGRDSGPWTDDDARRVNAIFDLLHLFRMEEIDMTRESFPMVAAQQAPDNPLLDAIEEKLAILNSRDPAIQQQNVGPEAPVKVIAGSKK